MRTLERCGAKRPIGKLSQWADSVTARAEGQAAEGADCGPRTSLPGIAPVGSPFS
jgi:hypothetical protein